MSPVHDLRSFKYWECVGDQINLRRQLTEEWNRNPMLLGVQNGVIDLRTGQLRHGKPEDRISIIAPVTFDAEATCPRWEQFIDEIFTSNPDIGPYMRRVIGYVLTGDVREQLFWVWYGEGANGKSTLGEILLKLLGPLGTTMPFPSRRWSESNEDSRKAMLLGRRFVQSSELREGDCLNEQLVKELVGGDTINARHLYGRPFTFEPTAKFFMRVNQRPKIADESHGMWRRVRLIPFVEKFDGERADKELTTTLLSELPGILNWAIRGCLDWQRDGLQEPACVMAATQEYRTEQNAFDRFLAECCILGAGEVNASGLYRAYEQWAALDGIPAAERLSSHKFGARASQRFDKDIRRDGRFYKGVQLGPVAWRTAA